MGIEYRVTHDYGFTIPAEVFSSYFDGEEHLERVLKPYRELTYGFAGDMNSLVRPGRDYFIVALKRFSESEYVRESDGFIWGSKEEPTPEERALLEQIAEVLGLDRPEPEHLTYLTVL